MARSQTETTPKKGKQFQAIKKQPQSPIRKSERLERKREQESHQNHTLHFKAVQKHHSQNRPKTDQKLNQKQKRPKETVLPQNQDEPTEDKKRVSLKSHTVEDKEVVSSTKGNKDNSISHWIKEGKWPKMDFEPRRTDLLPQNKRSFSSIQDEDSEVNESILGSEGTQAARNPNYNKQLIVAGIFLDENKASVAKGDLDLYRSFLKTNQSIPENSLFQDELFAETVGRYIDRSEAIIFRDITPLITPSAELMYAYGSRNLVHLREEINKIWTKCICLAVGPRPKPDFTVGLKPSAFTKAELEKLTPYVGGPQDTNFVQVTPNICFPFLTCEAKCGEVGLNIADRQNAHSASIAVNAVVQLYRAVSREHEVDRKILAFSISHDNETVRIFGHYARIEGKKVTFCRRGIHKFYFTALDGMMRWASYKFTVNLYDEFFPIHLERLKSAINQLPDPTAFLVDSFRSVPSADKSKSVDSQKTASIAPSSKNSKRSKRSKVQTKAMLQQENNWLKQQLAQEREKSH